MDQQLFDAQLQNIIAGRHEADYALAEVDALLEQVLQGDMAHAEKERCLKSTLSEKASLLYRLGRDEEASALVERVTRRRKAGGRESAASLAEYFRSSTAGADGNAA
jgi:hypothetical protein